MYNIHYIYCMYNNNNNNNSKTLAIPAQLILDHVIFSRYIMT